MLGMAPAAFAQTVPADDPPAEASGEIVVTAQRRSELISKVPVAITAFRGEDLAKNGTLQLRDFTAKVPNLQVSYVRGAAQPSFSLRGISVGNEPSMSQASPVGVYVDDIYKMSRSFHGTQMYDLDTVQVLRGPQGTLFGRNTTGGAINFITRTPQLGDNNGYLELGYGNFNRRSANGAAEVTLVPGGLGIRGAFNYVESDGRFRNLGPGPDVDNVDQFDARLSVKGKTGDLTATLAGYVARQNPLQAGQRAVGLGPNGESLLGYTPPSGFREAELGSVGHFKNVARGLSLKLQYDASDSLVFTSISGYDKGQVSYGPGYDDDAQPLDILEYSKFNTAVHQFNQELRANYTSDSIKAVLGFYYGDDTAALYADVLAYGSFGPPLAQRVINQFRQERSSTAFFGQMDYNITPQFVATLGLRYSIEKIAVLNGRVDMVDDAGNPIFALTPACGAALCLGEFQPTLKGESKPITWRAALNYTSDGGTLIYASASRGARGGAFNGVARTPVERANYVLPEILMAYEIGAKARIGTLRLAAAAFYYDYKDQQLFSSELSAGVNISVLKNAGKATIKGVELEGSWQPADGIAFTFTGGYLDTEFKDLALNGVSLAGNRLPLAPKFSGQVAADLTLGSPLDGDLVLTPSLSYNGKQFFSPQNDAPISAKGYLKANASLNWNIEPVTIRLWMNNVFNKKYVNFVSDWSFFGYNLVTPGDPREYGVAVKYKF